MVGDNLGMINQFKCKCGYSITTIDRDTGSTRFLIPCPSCRDFAYSAFYGVDQGLQPSHEWYEPGAIQLAGLAPHIAEYCRQGGLLLREIPQEETAIT